MIKRLFLAILLLMLFSSCSSKNDNNSQVTNNDQHKGVVDIGVEKWKVEYDKRITRERSEIESVFKLIKENKYITARAKILNACKNGNSVAQLLLGTMYLNGLGGNKNVCEAFKLIRMSATSDNIEAQTLLASFYRDGACIEKDIPAAIDLYKKSTLKGDKQAIYELGQIFIDIEEHQNLEEGVKYMKMLTPFGHKDAEFMLNKATALILTDQISKNPSKELYGKRGVLALKIGMPQYAKNDFYMACYGENGRDTADPKNPACEAYVMMETGMTVEEISVLFTNGLVEP